MNGIPPKIEDDQEESPGRTGNPDRIHGANPGVVYQCQRCANCCRWPGDVCLEEGEAAAIAGYLGMTEDAFIQEHTRLRANRTGLSLKEKHGGACAFLDGVNCCRINEVKPLQCRGFPNTWNFPGWERVCEAIPVSGSE